MLHRYRECLQSWCQTWRTSFCSLYSPPDRQRRALHQREENRTPTEPPGTLFTPQNMHKTAFFTGTLQCLLTPALGWDGAVPWSLLSCPNPHKSQRLGADWASESPSLPQLLAPAGWADPESAAEPPLLSSSRVSQNHNQHLPHSSSPGTLPARTSSGLFALWSSRNWREALKTKSPLWHLSAEFYYCFHPDGCRDKRRSSFKSHNGRNLISDQQGGAEQRTCTVPSPPSPLWSSRLSLIPHNSQC